MPSRQPQAGSTLIWLFLWIAGTAAIAYWCATRHVPAVQQQIQVNAEAAVSGVVASDVTTTVFGRTVTLQGTVADEIQKTDLLTALSTADGVRHINADGLTVIGSVAAVTESPVAPTNDSSDQPSVSEISSTESPGQQSAPVEASDTPSSNEPVSQNDGLTEETSDEPMAELPSAQSPDSDTAMQEAPSANLAPVEAPTPESPAPQTPLAEGPSPATLTAELSPPAPPSPQTPTPEAPSAEVLSPESPTPEIGPAEPLSPATPTPETLSAEAPSPVSPTNDSPNGPAPNNPGPADAPPDVNTEPSAVELAELGVANESAPSNSSDAPSPEAADPSPALVEVLEGEASTFSMQIKEGTLTLTGDISSEDDSLAFIQSAMRTFDVNYLVNSVQVSEENTKASWLPALTEFIPSLQPVSDASITIFESQITLSGTVPDKQTHDKITDEALSLLSELSLVDSIVVSSGDSTLAAAAASEPQAAVSTEPTDTSAQTGPTSQQAVGDATQPAAANPSTEKKLTSAAELSTLREAFKALEAEKILFESGSDVLTDESIQTVAAMSALLAKYTDINIEIDGHTDSAGSSESNLQLSQLRANAVRDLMIDRGIARERLSAYGFGDGVPIADNATADGRKLNRRIEFNF